MANNVKNGQIVMRRSIKSALPTLRPTTACTTKKERRHIFKLTGTDAPKTGIAVNEIELNRNIFQDVRPQTSDPENKPRTRKPKPKLQPMTQPKEKTPRRPKTQIRSEKAPTEPPQEEPEAVDPDLIQIEYLAGRLPDPNAELPGDVAFRIAPILDRILCTVTDMTQTKCVSLLGSPIVTNLHQRLFQLIDVDDFLIRVIVCRILLYFAADKTSSLLLPISRIFFKLSCEPSNDVYFIEESLETVLLTLMTIGEPEVKVMAAGALRNLAASAKMRAKLVDSDLFAIGFDIFHDKTDNEQLKIQVVGVFKRMCKEEKFRQKIAESHFLSMAANDKPVYCAVLRVAAQLPEMSKDEKLDFLDAFARIEYSNDDLIDSTMRALPVISSNVEDNDDCATTVNKLISLIGNDTDDLNTLIDIAMKMDESMELLKQNYIWVSIIESQDYDENIKSRVCDLLYKFKDPKFEAYISQYGKV